MRLRRRDLSRGPPEDPPAERGPTPGSPAGSNALLDAAEEVGEVEEEEILDKDGNSTGKFIGSLRLFFTTISI